MDGLEVTLLFFGLIRRLSPENRTKQIERQRGITVKAQTASMLYKDETTNELWLINLIDTPGHVDFSYEVSRALSACQGALMLVDSSQGVQAQTIANFNSIKSANLCLIPVITKIDLPVSDPEMSLKQMHTALGIEQDSVLWTSAKTGAGCNEIFPAVVKRLPSPTGSREAPLQCLLFDSWFDEYRGVVCVISVVNGSLSVGSEIVAVSTGRRYNIQEIGLVTPAYYPVKTLSAGQVGYVIAGMKTPQEANIGDTFASTSNATASLPGFKPSKPMVFASVYPVDTGEFTALEQAINKLLLTDSSVFTIRENSVSLGMGLRCGFLGLLHMDVFFQRLQMEFDTPVIYTAPYVPYTLKLKSGETKTIERPHDFPPAHLVEVYYEPMVLASIVTPNTTYGHVIRLLQDRRGEQVDVVYMENERVMLKYKLPWQEIVTDFYDKLKSITSGYASFDYEPTEEREADVVMVDILLNAKQVPELSFVCHRTKSQYQGRRVCEKLRGAIDRQQFEVVIQAAIGNKIFAKERIPPFRKDVLSKGGKTVGGGDVSRKKKLLEKQKKGKKRMKTVGRVELSQEAFHSVLTRE